MEKTLEKVESFVLYITILLFPFLVLPLSPTNPFVVTRLAVLVAGIALTLLVKSIRVIVTGKLEIRRGNFDIPVLVVGIAYAASAYLRTSNKMEAILLPGTATYVVGAVLVYFLLNQLPDKAKKRAGFFLTLSAIFYSVITLLASVKLFESIPQLPAFYRSANFTPENGYLPAVIFLATLLPIIIIGALKSKAINKKAFYGVSLIIVIFTLGLSIFKILPGKDLSPRFPSYSTGWSIAVDALKESPLLGYGPGNYLTAFNRFRPLAYNQTDLWALKFTTARSFFLTLLTETGFLGIAGVILLLLTFYRIAKKDIQEKRMVGWGAAADPVVISVIILFAAFLFLPATPVLLFTFFVLMAYLSTTKVGSLQLSTQGSSEDGEGGRAEVVTTRLPALLVTLPVIVASIYLGYRSVKILDAEYTYKRAVDAFAANEAIETYDTMQQAVNKNPLVQRYRTSYAQVNLALANSIALKANDPNAQITDQDRVNIAQLIQQAIREGKATVALNPLRSSGWEVLARIYQAIIPLAQGADQFTVQTMTQAVALDPVNPNLRIALGGVYYAAGNYNAASQVFQTAVALKGDLANAHYNLAFAYRDLGNYNLAVREMSTALSLVDADSPDYEVARQALEALEQERAQAAADSDNLTAPPTGEEPVLEPPLELDEEAQPPEAPVTPTPTAAPTATPAPETEAEATPTEAEGTENPTPTPLP
ncbi:tetratricopeptide repeat protein [Candidatus Woesebacteria bacterium]|nr:tetratricopeptide repeat protein [Candidatus Woesebacteria bacterium]